jgi:hypothetical protein
MTLKDHMIELLKFGSVAFVIGALAMAGMRVVEYGLEKPKMAIMVCFADDAGKVDACKPLAEK